VKRRVATEEEKSAHKEKRKGKCYWIDAVLTIEAQQRAHAPPAAAAAAAAVSASSSGAASAAAAPPVARSTPQVTASAPPSSTPVAAAAAAAASKHVQTATSPKRKTPVGASSAGGASASSKKRRSDGDNMTELAETAVSKLEASSASASGDNWMVGALKDYGKTSRGRKDPFANEMFKSMAKRNM
jgi:hypothetical protein